MYVTAKWTRAIFTLFFHVLTLQALERVMKVLASKRVTF